MFMKMNNLTTGATGFDENGKGKGKVGNDD